LPVIGNLVADAVQGVLPEHLVKKFSIGRQPSQPSDRLKQQSTPRIVRRIDTTRKLDERSLSTEGDLLPS